MQGVLMVVPLEKMKMRLLGILPGKVLMKMAIAFPRVFPRCVILHMFGFAFFFSFFFWGGGLVN
jgi:hypothetical protein